MSNWNWRLTLPLVVLYIIGIAGFWAPNYGPAIAATLKDGINQEWLGFLGNLVGAIMTLVAAVFAWFAVQRQINEQNSAAENNRKKHEFAARAILPLSLSNLHEYALECISAIERLPDPVSPDTIMNLPKVPLDDIYTIRNALHSMEDEPAQQLADTLQFLQIQRARLDGLEREVRDGSAHSNSIQRRLIEAIDLAGLIDRSYSYARGAGYSAPCLTPEEFESAFRKYTSSDISDYKIVEIELKRRAERDHACRH